MIDVKVDDGCPVVKSSESGVEEVIREEEVINFLSVLFDDVVRSFFHQTGEEVTGGFDDLLFVFSFLVLHDYLDDHINYCVNVLGDQVNRC